MNRWPIPVFCFALLIGPSSVAAAQDAVPDEIQTFYLDRNIVAAFSSPGERIALAGTEHPDTLSDRLRFVRGMMERLEALELDPDPRMLMPGQELQVTVPAALAKVVGFGYSGPDVLEVHLLVRELAWDDNLQFIRMYEAGKIPPVVHPSDFSPVSSREIHTWRRIGGRWLREPAGITLLSDG